MRTALRRSSEIVSGAWGRVFGITMAIYFLTETLATILFGSGGFLFLLAGIIEQDSWSVMIQRLYMPSPSEVGWLCYVILRVMLRSIYGLTTLPILAIGLTLLYFDVRNRRFQSTR